MEVSILTTSLFMVWREEPIRNPITTR